MPGGVSQGRRRFAERSWSPPSGRMLGGPGSTPGTVFDTSPAATASGPSWLFPPGARSSLDYVLACCRMYPKTAARHLRRDPRKTLRARPEPPGKTLRFATPPKPPRKTLLRRERIVKSLAEFPGFFPIWVFWFEEFEHWGLHEFKNLWGFSLEFTECEIRRCF